VGVGAEVAVYADAWASLNGRPAQRLLRPDVDLTQPEATLWAQGWVLPLGARCVPLNLRVAWEEEQKGAKKAARALPEPFKHSEVMYEPYLLPLEEPLISLDV
jgi:hypothetical protein